MQQQSTDMIASKNFPLISSLLPVHNKYLLAQLHTAQLMECSATSKHTNETDI